MNNEPTTRDLVLRVIAGDIDSVWQMHALGLSITEADQYGWLPIHRAAANDRAEIIRLLVDWGSPIEATGTDGWTPLHLAAVSRSPRAVNALITSGANIQARAFNGATPLHLAIGRTITEGMFETVRVLVEAGADVMAADRKGKTPRDEAREIGNAVLCRMLGV